MIFPHCTLNLQTWVLHTAKLYSGEVVFRRKRNIPTAYVLARTLQLPLSGAKFSALNNLYLIDNLEGDMFEWYRLRDIIVTFTIFIPTYPFLSRSSYGYPPRKQQQ